MGLGRYNMVRGMDQWETGRLHQASKARTNQREIERRRAENGANHFIRLVLPPLLGCIVPAAVWLLQPLPLPVLLERLFRYTGVTGTGSPASVHQGHHHLACLATLGRRWVCPSALFCCPFVLFFGTSFCAICESCPKMDSSRPSCCLLCPVCVLVP